MKRIFAMVLCAAVLLLCGCSSSQPQQYSKTYYDVFDTVTTLSAQAQSESDFLEAADKLHRDLLEYHKLFDIYYSYENIVNLHTINNTAHLSPVQADSRIIDLLLYCKEVYTVTGGKVNAAMGSVLSLWHQAREDGIKDPANALLPDEKALQEAARHIDFNNVIIDQSACTVYFADPALRLDAGAIAKGWAVQQAAENAPSGWLLNVGGNVVATGPKTDGRAWKVAVQDPSDSGAYLLTLSVTGGCVVTSGDYQRTYTVNGKSYHHIIDPSTLYPAALWRSVTVICSDSADADMLSTALFLMDQAAGQALLDQYDAEAMWVDASGQQHFSPEFDRFIQK